MKQYSIEEFFRNAPTAAYQISPDGRHISYMSPYKDRMNLFVVPIGGETEPRQLTFETERSIQGYMWAGNGRLLFAKDTAGDENYRLYGIGIDGSDEICYTPFDGVRAGILDDLEDVPDEVLIEMNKRNPEAQNRRTDALGRKSGKLSRVAHRP